jgi:hypothetical protein
MQYKRTIATAIALCSGVCALGSVVTDAQAASGPRVERCTNDALHELPVNVVRVPQ